MPLFLSLLCFLSQQSIPDSELLLVNIGLLLKTNLPINFGKLERQLNIVLVCFRELPEEGRLVFFPILGRGHLTQDLDDSILLHKLVNLGVGDSLLDVLADHLGDQGGELLGE